MTADDVRRELRLFMAERMIRQKEVAGMCGVSISFVSAVLDGDREPSEKICELIGVRKTIVVVRTATYKRISSLPSQKIASEYKPKKVTHATSSTDRRGRD